jgi:Putative zinc-finger
MITHPDPEQLSAYVDGELTGGERDDLEQHLTGCSECSATLRALRATVADVRALPQPAPSEQDTWALRAAIAKARKRPMQRYRWAIAASSVAAAAIAVVVSLNVGHHARTTSSPQNKALAGGSVLGPTASPVIEIDPTNYTSASAKTLLERVRSGGTNTFTTAATPSAEGQTLEGRTSVPQSLPQAASSADQSRYLSQISRCQSLVLSKDTSGARAIAYIVGRYQSTPVFFLVYSLVSGGKTEAEMWAVRQTDCYILLFLAPH